MDRRTGSASCAGRAEQTVGSICRLHYMGAMQCRPPILLTTPSAAAPPPPPLHHQHHHHRHHHHYHYLNRNAGRHTFDPAVRKACVGSGPITTSLAGPCPLKPALCVAYPLPLPVPTHKKWHHFLVKRDERLPLLHIGPPAIMLGNRDTIDSTAISPAHCPGSQIRPWARWHAVRP